MTCWGRLREAQSSSPQAAAPPPTTTTAGRDPGTLHTKATPGAPGLCPRVPSPRAIARPSGLRGVRLPV